MGQKLSAMTYIKNNKRRVSVLVISMAMCLVLFYLTQFLLSVSTETFRVFLVEQAYKVQYAYLPNSAFGLDFTGMSNEEAIQLLIEEYEKLGERLEELDGVEKVYFVDIGYALVSAVVAQSSVEMPMLPSDEIEGFMEHCGVELIAGRLPKEQGEVILSENILRNRKLKLGDETGNVKIVGVVDDEYYFACSVGGEVTYNTYNNAMLCILTDGSIEDISAEFRKLGYTYNEEDAYFFDVKNGKHDLKVDVAEPIEFSTNLIYIGIVCVLSFLVLIVYISYLRDRRNEWCLYSSIGFSRGTIYAAVMRELIFTFVSALVLAVILITVSVVILDYTMVQGMGLRCRYLHWDVIVESLCVFVVILGILQIPIRYALYKIRTIDAIDDELNA